MKLSNFQQSKYDVGQTRIPINFIDRETLSDDGEGFYAYIIPPAVMSISLFLRLTDCIGKVEYTHSSLSRIESDNAIWNDWKHGSVNSTGIVTKIDDVIFPVMAVRAFKDSGAGFLEFESTAH